MKKATKLFLAGLLCLSTGICQAQVIRSVPPNDPNNRFMEEIFLGIERPGLSVIGFDNGGDNQYGYGLKQVLNQVWQTTQVQVSSLLGILFGNIGNTCSGTWLTLFSLDSDLNSGSNLLVAKVNFIRLGLRTSFERKPGSVWRAFTTRSSI